MDLLAGARRPIFSGPLMPKQTGTLSLSLPPRAAYAERLSVLRESATQRLDGLVDVSRVEAGLQTVGWLRAGIDAPAASNAAAARNVEAIPLHVYFRRRPTRQRLPLGFDAVAPVEI